MKIDLTREVGGVPLRRVRDLLRWTGNGRFSRRTAAIFLKCDEEQATKVLQALAVEGFVEEKEPGEYDPTDAGTRLSASTAWKRFPREKAEPSLARIIANAEAINADDDYMYFVDELRVFGSYLDPGQHDLGDIDVAVKLGRRPQYEKDWASACFGRARESGRRLSILGQLTYPDQEVLSALRRGTRYVQFITADTLDRLQTRSRVLYTRGGSRRRKLVLQVEYWVEDEDKLLAAGRKAAIGSKYYTMKEDDPTAPFKEHTVTEADFSEEGMSARERQEARDEWMTDAMLQLCPLMDDEEEKQAGLSQKTICARFEHLDAHDLLIEAVQSSIMEKTVE